MHYSCETGNLELSKLLISKYNLDVESADNNHITVLHSACFSSNLELVKYLISLNKIDISSKDHENNTILDYALNSNNTNYNLIKLIDLRFLHHAKMAIMKLQDILFH